MFSIFITVCICCVAAEWISTTSLILPQPRCTMGIGHDQSNTLFLIGGMDSTSNPQTMLKYNISSDPFIFNISSIPRKVWGYGQHYVQSQHVIYMIDPATPKINKYDISSDQFTANIFSSSIPINPRTSACIAASSQAVYVVGGKNTANVHLSDLQIYNLSTNQWVTGPHMLKGRDALSCIVSTGNDRLYSVGGAKSAASSEHENSIEWISLENIKQNEWQYTINNLSEPLIYTSAVSYREYIYIVGGRDWNVPGQPTDKVHILDTSTNVVSLLPDRLKTAVWLTSSIIINNVLYVIGGAQLEWIKIDEWQYYRLSIPTSVPTKNPSDSPITSAPTKLIQTTQPSNAPADVPSISPTYLPSITPTYMPSIFPTYTPSIFPTYMPSIFPTYMPSISPTQSKVGQVAEISTTETNEQNINLLENNHANQVTVFIIAAVAICCILSAIILLIVYKNKLKSVGNKTHMNSTLDNGSSYGTEINMTCRVQSVDSDFEVLDGNITAGCNGNDLLMNSVVENGENNIAMDNEQEVLHEMNSLHETIGNISTDEFVIDEETNTMGNVHTDASHGTLFEQQTNNATHESYDVLENDIVIHGDDETIR